MTREYSPPRDPSAASLDLTIVVPAFNEEGRIVATLEELRAYLSSRAWRWEVVVVDDGSTDGTVRAVEEAARTDGRVRVHPRTAPRQGGSGPRGAARVERGASIHLRRRPVHAGARAGAVHAAGPRDGGCCDRQPRGGGARRVGEPLFRHVTGRVFNRLVQRLAVPGIEDTQCGFKMFTARAVETVFPHVTVEGWAFDIGVLYLARRAGLRILEVPIEWHHREESRLNMSRDTLDMLRELRRIHGRARRGSHAVAPTDRRR